MSIGDHYPVGHPLHACVGCPHDVKPVKDSGMGVHSAAEDGEVELLTCLLDDCRQEIKRLREELGLIRPEILVTGDGRLPTRAHVSDAGLDLYVQGSHQVWPGQFLDIPCGISVELPAGFWGMIAGRSSTLRKRNLLVAQGVIDTGYRGPLFAGVWNLSHRPTRLGAGERVAQLLIFPNVTERMVIQRVSQLGLSERGERGFGSSGS